MSMNKQKRKTSLSKSLAILSGTSSDEPTVTQDSYKVDISKALNWYNSRWDEKTYFKTIREYLKHADLTEYSTAVSKANMHDIRIPAIIGRLIMREQHVEFHHVQHLMDRLEELKNRFDADAEPGEQRARVSIQEKIASNAQTLAAPIEVEIDNFIKNGCKSEFSMNAYLSSNNVSGVVAKKIGEIFEPTLRELDEAILGDEDLKEGYSFLGRRGLTKFREFMASIVSACAQQVVSAKAQRKPRARKAKPPHVIVKNVQLMREYAELDLKSVSADKIVGADEIWFYIPEKRKLVVYYAANGEPLTVKGKTIINYDVERSGSKTIRKPELFFKNLQTGKRAMNNAWKGIKGKVGPVKARISNQMLLLAAN